MQTENEVACHGALRRRVLYYMDRPIQSMSRTELFDVVEELLDVVEELFEDHERMQQNMAQDQRMQGSSQEQDEEGPPLPLLTWSKA